MDPELFPSLPENLSALTGEELEALREEYRASGRAVRDGEAEVGSLDGAAVLARMKQAKADLDLIEAEITTRAEGEAEFTRQAAELAEAMGVTDEADGAETTEPTALPVEGSDELAAEGEDDPADPDPDPEATPAEVAAVEEPEPVLAAAIAPTAPVATAPTPRLPATGRSSRYDMLPAEETGASLTALAGIEGFREGARLDRDGLSKAMISKMGRLPTARNKNGTREAFSVARVEYPFPPERHLVQGDLGGNTDKIRVIGSPYLGQEGLDVFQASGGLCAPLEPIYSVPSIGTTARPVRDALPSFRADRGGVSVPTPFTASDLAGGITVIEESADALGGTFATKACFRPNCPAFTDVAVGIISHCIEHGNLNARAWPEFVTQMSDELMVEHSRIADGRLLDRLDALSLHLTQTAVYGASATLLWALQLSRVGIISRLRLDPNTRFRVILPFWAAAMFAQDLVNGQFDRFDTPTSQVGALLSTYGFDVTWHLDQGVAGGATAEVFSADATGPLDDWLGTTLIARVFPEGTFLHLDAGTLDFGLIRDSTLNATNDYELFAEIFENVARIGPAQAAHRLAITICPSGTVSALSTPITCS